MPERSISMTNRFVLFLLLCTALLLALAFTVTAAAPDAQKMQQVAKKLVEERWPGATNIKIAGEGQDNGVPVADATFTTKDGHPGFAHITGGGHFLLAGTSEPLSSAPGSIQSGIGNALKTTPTQVQSIDRTEFLVNMDVGGRQQQLVVDAAGNLHDIRNQREIRGESAIPEPNRTKLGDLALRHAGGGGKIDSVMTDPETPHFAIVTLTDKNGTQHMMTLDTSGEVLASAEAIPANALPQHVTNAVQNLFKNSKITGAFREQRYYYQITSPDQNGRTLTFWVQPNGDVASVGNRAGNEAVPAGGHEMPQ
jgi:hypothetical protein